MKGYFRKSKQLQHKRFSKLALWCGGVALLLALFVGSGVPKAVYAWTIPITYSYTPVQVGGNTTISWSTPYSDTCQLSGPTIINPVCASDQACYHQYSAPGSSGSYNTGPINGPTNYQIICNDVSGGFNGSTGVGNVSFTVNTSAPASDNCPASPDAVANGLHVPGGTYHIVAQGYDFCITNNSGKYLFVPASTAAQVNNFRSATQGYLAGTVVYFARTAGY